MCAHTFGRRMMYPGATALMNSLLGMSYFYGYFSITGT